MTNSTTFSCNTYPERSHYKFIMRLGRVFPSTKSQARTFINEGLSMDVLNEKDVQVLETLMNKHGFEGEYKPTKSGRWVRLLNHNDLYKALKKEYKF